MSFFEALKGFGSRLFRDENKIRPESEDGVTTDNYLRTLRRERRTQLEEQEKIMLKKKIAEYKRDRTRRLLLGIRKKINEKKSNIVDYKKRGFLGRSDGFTKNNLLR